jgi:hypothetical protein
MLDYVLKKPNTGVDPYFIDVWVPMHRDDAEATHKLVSINFNTFVCIICFNRVCNNFTFVQDRYTEELRKIHGPDTARGRCPSTLMLRIMQAEVYRMGGM